MCVTPPNTGAYKFCGCGQLDQDVDIQLVGGLTNLTYYTCLQNITGSLILIDDPDLATLTGLEVIVITSHLHHHDACDDHHSELHHSRC